MDNEYTRALALWVNFGGKACMRPEIKLEIHQTFYRWLVSNVVKRALLDITPEKGAARKVSEADTKSAIEFLRSDLCRLFCNDLGMRYNILLEKVEKLWASRS